jgi:hypothetical protein
MQMLNVVETIESGVSPICNERNLNRRPTKSSADRWAPAPCPSEWGDLASQFSSEKLMMFKMHVPGNKLVRHSRVTILVLQLPWGNQFNCTD